MNNGSNQEDLRRPPFILDWRNIFLEPHKWPYGTADGVFRTGLREFLAMYRSRQCGNGLPLGDDGLFFRELGINGIEQRSTL